jgi:hypothetical protein
MLPTSKTSADRFAPLVAFAFDLATAYPPPPIARYRLALLAAAFFLGLSTACSPPASLSTSATVARDGKSVLAEAPVRPGFPVPRAALGFKTTKPTLLVPLYASVGPVWSRLIAEKIGHPTVEVAAVVNPDNGPGRAYDPAFAAGEARLAAAGIRIYGYVYTSYGTRPLAAVKADIDSYAAWYPMTGLFIDNVAGVTGFERYYVALRAYARTKGLPHTIGNAGVVPPSSYGSAADELITYEAEGWPAASIPLAGDDEAPHGIIALGVPFDAARLVSATSSATVFYATDRSGPTAYSELPTYVDALFDALAR